MTILVTGARGGISRAVAGQLLEAGHEVRVGGRVPEGDVVELDLARPETFGAVQGIRAVFLYAELGGLKPFLDAAREAGVEQVVLLSARGADPAAADAIMRVHGEAEAAVRESGIPWTFLRPGGFATNRLWWAADVRAGRAVREPFPDSQSALIHEADLAAVARHALTEPGHANAAYALTGPESLTARRQAELIGEAIGRPVSVERQDLAEYRRELAHLPAELLETRIRRLAALTGKPDPTTATVEEVTGTPARGFAEWAADHAADFG
ncbi:NAD(P)H-binding protein [Amycolatopsis acidicola]|uniref:NAD(P)H-binding protein n=1 Tax=Amycolatopsis acidicola TaxID=2596893 RepID=A0A5N0V1K3_9PSEU|nr:NAD(P)H-binding protein [Amycolatopsis acidicola]KAA9160266.1 NAD(P)H-binding protein [Amycolatopsis acidicola]